MSEGVIQPDWIPQDTLRHLHPVAIDDPAEIRRLLARICEERIELRRGTNRYALPERAWIERVGPEGIVLSLENFDSAQREQIFLNVSLDGVAYFFGSTERSRDSGRLEAALPAVVFRAERRDRRRRPSVGRRRVGVHLGDGAEARGHQVDTSPGGAGIELDRPVSARAGQAVILEFGGPGDGARAYAEIRHLQKPAGEGRWRRLGLVLTHAPRGAGLLTEKRSVIAPPMRVRSLPSARRAERTARRVAYRNDRGEEIRALVDSVGDAKRAIAVIIPPAWGRTKESTLPLAETILQTFEQAGESVVVVRFDGIRRRGESHNDPGCLPPIGENRNYTFSQGVRDIQATLDFLGHRSQFAGSPVYVVSLSIASVEARRAIADDTDRRIAGWLSIVGAVDPQSMIRVVSGGVDYFAGVAEGLRFGTQYIQGLLFDTDIAVRDGVESGIAFLDDARRDMARIEIPVTWIAGTEDAWTSGDRVADMLSVGPCSQRKLIELSIGHQLRSSREALETFELAAFELARMALGRSIPSVQPERAAISGRRKQERQQLKMQAVDLREFWKEYLVGRDGRLGIELMSATSAYRALMDQQIAALDLAKGGGQTIVDLGSGAGAFPVQLAEYDIGVQRIIEVDLVPEGLQRTRLRREQGRRLRDSIFFVAADLDGGGTGAGIPLADASADAVLMSLFLNYVSQPKALLAEVVRILRPGGRLVVSGMREDADISKICVAGVAELRSRAARILWNEGEIGELDQPLQEFISSGARILDMEESGIFHFWDADDLRTLIEGHRLRVLAVEPGYGTPPQAWVVTAERRRE